MNYCLTFSFSSSPLLVSFLLISYFRCFFSLYVFDKILWEHRIWKKNLHITCLIKFQWDMSYLFGVVSCVSFFLFSWSCCMLLSFFLLFVVCCYSVKMYLKSVSSDSTFCCEINVLEYAIGRLDNCFCDIIESLMLNLLPSSLMVQLFPNSVHMIMFSYL